MPPPSEEVFSRERDATYRDLEVFLKAEVGLTAEGVEPVGFEVGFAGRGSEGEEPLSQTDPVEVRLPGARFHLNGRIDRIDRLRDGTYQVVDYKTGSLYWPAYTRVPPRAAAAARALRRRRRVAAPREDRPKGARCVGPLQLPDGQGRRPLEGAFAGRKPETVGRVRRGRLDIAGAGAFMARPDKKDSKFCERCDSPAVRRAAGCEAGGGEAQQRREHGARAVPHASRRTRMPEHTLRSRSGAPRLIKTRLDVNLLVEAGAGSGKTDSLAERMAAGIVSGHYVVEQMAAVTFTRKAAAELRGRFQLALEARLAKRPTGRREGAHRHALASLERLFAGTIHSFCARLLRERPVEARLAPGFTELDEAEDAEHAQAGVARLPGTASGPRLAGASGAHRTPTSYAPDLDNAFDTICTFEEVEFPAGRGQAARHAEPAWKALRAFLEQARRSFSRDDFGRHDVQGAAAPARRPAGCASPIASGPATRRAAQALGVGTLEHHPDWWADDTAEKKRLAAETARLLADFQARTVRPFLAAWRQYHLPPGGDAAGRRARVRARGAVPRADAELQRPAAGRRAPPARPSRASAVRSRRSTAGSSSTSSRTPIPSRPR